MSLTVKIVLAAALIFEYRRSFGAFAAGERPGANIKLPWASTALLFFGTLITASVLMFSGQAYAAGEAAESAVNSAAGMGYIAAALSTGLSGIGGRYRCFRRCFGILEPSARTPLFSKIAHASPDLPKVSAFTDLIISLRDPGSYNEDVPDKRQH